MRWRVSSNRDPRQLLDKVIMSMHISHIFLRNKWRTFHAQRCNIACNSGLHISYQQSKYGGKEKSLFNGASSYSYKFHWSTWFLPKHYKLKHFMLKSNFGSQQINKDRTKRDSNYKISNEILIETYIPFKEKDKLFCLQREPLHLNHYQHSNNH